MKQCLLYIIIFTIPLSSFCFNTNEIKLPKEFRFEIYATDLNQPRGLTKSEEDTLYIGSKSGFIYQISKNRQVSIIDRGLKGPIGIDYYKGDLYVSEVNQIRVYKNIKKQHKPYRYKIINNTLPSKRWHGWKYIKVGDDNKIYINIGAPCNRCLENNIFYGTISRMDLNGENLEVYSKGVRNSVGFDWHPKTKSLWFTDNGADNFGDNVPSDELNRVDFIKQHFGFPYIHGKDFFDPTFHSKIGLLKTTPPALELPAHVAPLGMRFYTGESFPEYYKNGIFIAEHGSWNRSRKIGYRISFVKIIDNKALSYEVFAKGWLKDDKVLGRPVDIEILSDGSLVLSDDFSGNIYRIYRQ